MTVAFIALTAVVGSLIGSFANVVVYRWPRGESVVHPRSRCPRCGHVLEPIDLVPIFSWLFLRGRCRHCGAPVSGRYPLVEAAFALGFGLIAWAYPVEIHGWGLLVMLTIFSMLSMAALIDYDTYLLPDGLTLPAVAVGIIGAFLYARSSGLPTPLEAATGAAISAGVLVLINRLGGLVLRRFRDTEERLWPFSLDAVNVAALVGLVGGWSWGLVAGGLQVLASALLRRPVRLPEPILYLLWLAGLVLVGAGWTSAWGVGVADGLLGTFLAAGAMAVLGACWWWGVDLVKGDRKAPQEEMGNPEEDEGEPVAMGFGDVKLAAALGALLAWHGFLVGFLFAVLLGAVFGLVQRAMGGSRFVPFGPYLVLGGFLALAFAAPLVNWYLRLLGV